MKLRLGALACVTAFSFGTVAFANEAAEAEKLTGTWTVETDNANRDATSWVFEDKGNSLKITRMQGGEKLAEFECNTVGKDCEFKDSREESKGVHVVSRSKARTARDEALFSDGSGRRNASRTDSDFARRQA